MKMYRVLLILFGVIILQSCQKDLNENLNSPVEENLSRSVSEINRTANQSPYYWSNRSVM
jgi:hypothetical protein